MVTEKVVTEKVIAVTKIIWNGMVVEIILSTQSKLSQGQITDFTVKVHGAVRYDSV